MADASKLNAANTDADASKPDCDAAIPNGNLLIADSAFQPSC